MKRCIGCACKKKYLPQRYVLAVLCIFGVVIGYGQRTCLSFGITEMTEKNESRSSACPERNYTFIKGIHQNMTGGIVDWTNTQQHYVIGSFYLGYCIGHVPAGLLCDRFGGRYLFLIGIAFSSVLTIVTPKASMAILAILLRIVMGLMQSVIFPAISVLYDKWVPKEKVWLWIAFAMAASAPGIVFGNLLTGAVIQLFAQWTRPFIIWGVVGIVWCLIYLIYAYSEPDTHRFITDAEKELLQSVVKNRTSMKYPWKGIFTCLRFWATVMAEVGHGFTFYTLANSLPKYIHNVLQYEMAENAIGSSVPFALQWFGALISCKITEFLIVKKGIKTILCRRIMTSIGIVLPPLFNVVAGFMECAGTMVFIMFAIGMLFKGCCYAGVKVNHLDMSINFCGILMALINGIGAITGVISSFLLSAIASNNTLSEWMILFWILLGAAVATDIFYCIFTPDGREKWDYPPEEMAEYEEAQEEKNKQKVAKKAK